ncbi:transposase [Mesorhizobium sp. M7A.F.Ce.TU.012.03.2.1]|uniref:transposase n=1 Tax=Mesorhizobium sp. M7A.F.Ce.TU.012.03.2.1 TaxID=2493681 RepID=UPI0032AEFB25
MKAITEELCGHAFSASTVSQATARLDEALKAFFEQRLAEPYPNHILDARYERAREAGVIASQAMLVAIGVDWEGRRQVLGVELANRESHSSWRAFVAGLKQRGRRVCRLRRPSWAQGSDPGSPRPRQSGSAVTCTSSETRSIMCRARSMTTA